MRVRGSEGLRKWVKGRGWGILKEEGRRAVLKVEGMCFPSYY